MYIETFLSLLSYFVTIRGRNTAHNITLTSNNPRADNQTIFRRYNKFDFSWDPYHPKAAHDLISTFFFNNYRYLSLCWWKPFTDGFNQWIHSMDGERKNVLQSLPVRCRSTHAHSIIAGNRGDGLEELNPPPSIVIAPPKCWGVSCENI